MGQPEAMPVATREASRERNRRRRTRGSGRCRGRRRIGDEGKPSGQDGAPQGPDRRQTHSGRWIDRETALEALAPEAAAGGRLALLPLENPSLVESLHKAYFEAGSDLVETATFSASARDLAHFARDYPGGAEALSYAVNRAGGHGGEKSRPDNADTVGIAGAKGTAGAARRAGTRQRTATSSSRDR